MKPLICQTRKEAFFSTRIYSSTANLQKKILVVFLGIFGILRSIIIILCIYTTISLTKANDILLNPIRETLLWIVYFILFYDIFIFWDSTSSYHFSVITWDFIFAEMYCEISILGQNLGDQLKIILSNRNMHVAGIIRYRVGESELVVV